MRVASADPGKRGSLAVLQDGEIVTVIPMPTYNVGRKIVYDLDKITAFIKASKAELVAVEQVTRPGSLVGNAAFIFGVAYGLGIDAVMLRPQFWKGKLGLSADKAQSLAYAEQRWPSLGKLKKGEDGKAEAALIGLVAEEIYG